MDSPTLEGTEQFDRLKSWVDDKARQASHMTPEEKQERQRVDEELQERRRQKEIEASINALLPPRRRGLEIENDLIRTWTEQFIAGEIDYGLIVAGPTGTGKTGNVAAAIEKIIRSEYRGSIEYHGWRTLLRELQPGGSFDLERFKLLCRSTLLFLDDVGSRKGSEWAEDQLLDVIDERYEWGRPTLLTINAQPADIPAVVGTRVASRLKEVCVTVIIDGPDRRQAPGQILVKEPK